MQSAGAGGALRLDNTAHDGSSSVPIADARSKSLTRLSKDVGLHQSGGDCRGARAVLRAASLSQTACNRVRSCNNNSSPAVSENSGTGSSDVATKCRALAAEHASVSKAIAALIVSRASTSAKTGTGLSCPNTVIASVSQASRPMVQAIAPPSDCNVSVSLGT